MNIGKMIHTKLLCYMYPGRELSKTRIYTNDHGEHYRYFCSYCGQHSHIEVTECN